MKSLFRSIFGFFVALFVILLLIEVALWLFHRQGIEPEFSLTMKQNEPGLKPEVVIEENALGLRGLAFNTLKKPEKTVRILVIGDILAKLPVQSLADTWLVKFEANLNSAWKEKGWKAEVASYGTSLGTAQQLARWYRNIGSTFKPDAVIASIGLDDDLQAEQFIFDHQTSKELLDEARAPYPNYKHLPFGPVFLQRYSQIYRHYHGLKRKNALTDAIDLAKGVNPSTGNLPDQRKAYAKLPAIRGSALSTDQGKEIFSAVADDLFQAISASGALPVALGAPTLQHDGLSAEEQSKLWMPIIVNDIANHTSKQGRLWPGDFYDALMAYNQIAHDKVAAHGGLYVDLPHQLAPTAENFVDDAMPTDIGNTHIANILSQALTKPLTEKFVK